jgi:hypothetical protein
MPYETDSAKNSEGCIMKFYNKDKHKSVNTFLVLNRVLNFKQLSNMSHLTLTNKKLKSLKLQVLKLEYYFETSYSAHFKQMSFFYYDG